MLSPQLSRGIMLVAAVAVTIVVVDRVFFSGPKQSTPVPAAVHATAHKEIALHPELAGDSLTLTVHKSPTCGCCKKWVEHMEANGFKVVTVDHADMTPVKRELGVQDTLQSCHTSTIGSYVIEGHVPAEDVLRLLRERPQVAGLAVPRMPMGSPGMEGLVKEKYDVLTFDKNGATKVFSHR